MPTYPYKDKPQPKSEHKSQSFGTAANLHLGSSKAPLQLCVQSDARKQALSLECEQNNWVAEFEVVADKDEDIRDLEYMQNKPKTVSVEKTPARNEPCSCGSGKKYKKCCG